MTITMIMQCWGEHISLFTGILLLVGLMAIDVGRAMQLHSFAVSYKEWMVVVHLAIVISAAFVQQLLSVLWGST